MNCNSSECWAVLIHTLDKRPSHSLTILSFWTWHTVIWPLFWVFFCKNLSNCSTCFNLTSFFANDNEYKISTSIQYSLCSLNTEVLVSLWFIVKLFFGWDCLFFFFFQKSTTKKSASKVVSQTNLILHIRISVSKWLK